MNAKEKIAMTITVISGTVWSIDAATKQLALHYLPHHPVCVIPNLLYFALGINPGGSLGIPSQYIEFCITLPATLLFLVAMWIGRRLRTGKMISLIQQVGFGVFIGGALGNWVERVLHGGVTDFIYLQLFNFCIFNLADCFIDLGYLIVVVETFRLAWLKGREQKRQTSGLLTVE